FFAQITLLPSASLGAQLFLLAGQVQDGPNNPNPKANHTPTHLRADFFLDFYSKAASAGKPPFQEVGADVTLLSDLGLRCDYRLDMFLNLYLRLGFPGGASGTVSTAGPSVPFNLVYPLTYDVADAYAKDPTKTVLPCD